MFSGPRKPLVRTILSASMDTVILILTWIIAVAVIDGCHNNSACSQSKHSETVSE